MSTYSAYGDHLAEGDRLQACDKHGDWGKAIVKRVVRSDSRIKFRVYFVGWDALHDEWIAVGDDRLRPSLKSRSKLGTAALHRRLKLQWAPGEWYTGTVTQFDGDDQLHLVVFDDEDEDWYHLEHEESAGLLQWIDGPRREHEPSSAPAATTVRPSLHVCLTASCVRDVCACRPRACVRDHATAYSVRLRLRGLRAFWQLWSCG